jgi:hypothetical protein
MRKERREKGLGAGGRDRMDEAASRDKVFANRTAV